MKFRDVDVKFRDVGSLHLRISDDSNRAIFAFSASSGARTASLARGAVLRHLRRPHWLLSWFLLHQEID